jgi:hypothetical protein
MQEEMKMQFKVSFKGMSRFIGSLTFATNYIEKNWGSLTQAYELGVKMEPVALRAR